MSSAKKEKIFEDLTIGVYKGVPNYFGIYWDDEGKGLWVCSQTRVYSILRLNARIMDESGRVLTFDESSRDFSCCLRQGSPEKPKKSAFLLLDQNGQYLLSSKEDWIEADIYLLAVQGKQTNDTPRMPLTIWAHFRKHSEEGNFHPQNHVVAISSDSHIAWLLDALANSFFPSTTPNAIGERNSFPRPMTKQEENDDE